MLNVIFSTLQSFVSVWLFQIVKTAFTDLALSSQKPEALGLDGWEVVLRAGWLVGLS